MEAVTYNQEQLDLARLSAYLDGEGSILLQRSPRGKKRSLSYQLRLKIVNTDIRLLVWCQKNYGGTIALNRKGTNKYPPLFRWDLSGALKVLVILKGCLPFFVIKREQAEIGIAFGETFDSAPKHSRKKLLDSVNEQREELRRQIVSIRRIKPVDSTTLAS